MSAPKHTPGPWIVVPVSEREARIEGDGGFVKVANLLNEHNGGEEATAVLVLDARLIAAAPELAEALDALLLAVDQHRKLGHIKGVDVREDQARAALKKAGVL